MELKCLCYDARDVDISNIFYHAKTMSDKETHFLFVENYMKMFEFIKFRN
jgi:hypothetical protein